MPLANDQVFKKYLFLLITGILFGSQFILTVNALKQYTALEVGVLRLIFGFLGVAVLVPVFGKKEPKLDIKWYQYSVVAFFEGTLPCLLVPWGQRQVQSSLASVIISTTPIFVMILGPLVVKNEKFSLMNALSVLIGFIGVYILIHPSDMSHLYSKFWPACAILIASASWAFSLILIKALPNHSPIRLTRNILFVATLEMIMAWVFLGNPLAFQFHQKALLNAIILGAINSGVVYVFYVFLIRLGGVNFAAFSNYLVVLVAGVIGVFFLNETLTQYEVMGSLIILIGLIIQSVYDRKINDSLKSKNK